MQFSKRKVWAALMAGSVMPFSAHASNTEDVYPVKRVTIVVGFSQGGGVDILSRYIAKELELELGVSVVVENRPGATSNIAAEHVARSMADGHTIFVSSRSNVTYGALQEQPRYDFRKDLQSVGLMATVPNVVVAGRHTSISTAKEMVALAKAQPQSLRCASSGVGSTGHLLCEEFQQEAKVEMVHVPYTYTDQAFTHILGGHVDAIFISLPAALPYIRAGAVQAIAIAGNERAPSAPGIPTFQEEGLDNIHGESWFGLMVPAATPKKAVEKLNVSLNRVLAKRQLREQLSGLGYVLPSQLNSRDAFEQLIVEETAHWTDLITERRIAPGSH
ncbi:tripartite tricarboxylate transporter substrate binding protein [Bordetella sp. LUAb4]|uniref:Bug family tripartite tricarboxylate transporter substrate binding protein n=1 Tax=Bordetella sp. LUAb4 TaxID=2843195 RepID=UPI001E4F9850|nr:tripartite tricarboxylate transporter substrate-binding protein [Bordetella sp. LUAb4]